MPLVPFRRAGSLNSYTSNSASPPTYTLTVPATAVVSDLAIITVATFSSTVASITQTGWTKITGPVYATGSISIFWKILVAGDPGSTVTVSSTGYGSNQLSVISVEVWGNAAPVPTATFSSNSTGVFASVTAPVNSVPLYIWSGFTTGASLPPNTVTSPGAWTGSYNRGTPTNAQWPGLGVWYDAPLTVANSNGGTVTPSPNSAAAALATLIIAPSAITIFGDTIANKPASSGVRSVAIPSQAPIGSTAIICAYGYMSGVVTPTGWTKLSPAGGDGTCVFTKVITAGDLGATVGISGLGWADTTALPIDLQIWQNVGSVTASFQNGTATSTVFPSIPSVIGAVPLYAWTGYTSGSNASPTSFNATTGWVGNYTRSTYNALGVWYAPPLTTSTNPGGSLSQNSGIAGSPWAAATIMLLPPAVVQNAYILGANAGADVLTTSMLLGANAGLDKALLWTP